MITFVNKTMFISGIKVRVLTFPAEGEGTRHWDVLSLYLNIIQEYWILIS